MINDKLKSLVHTLKLLPSDRVPTRSLRNATEYKPEKALSDLNKYLKEASLKSGVVSSITSEDYIVQKDPYTTQAKIQFEEAVRADGIVQRALIRKCDFVFAKGVRTVLDTMEDVVPESKPKTKPTEAEDGKKIPSVEESRMEAIDAVLGNTDYQKAKKIVDRIHRKVNLRYYLRAAYFNCKTYGRSALLIDEEPYMIKDKDYEQTKKKVDSGVTYPSSLQILNSKLLGNVYCDKKNNQLAYVEYNTNEADKFNNKTFYEPKDMIYFTNLDYNISPNTLYYGYSEIEPVKDVSETSRVLDEEDFKEWARSLIFGYLILTLPNLQNEREVNNLLGEMKMGAPTAITGDIGAQVLKIADGLADGINLHLENDRRVLRALGMPSFTIGFEDVTNRATTQFILHAWKESFIEQERIWIKDIIQKQWLNPIWAKALGMEVEEVEDLDAKITLEFEEYNFDTFAQNVDAWLPLVQAGYISVEDFLEKIGEPELARKYKDVKKELVKQGFVPSMGQSNPAFGFGKGVKNDPTENQTSFGDNDDSDLGDGGLGKGL